MKDLYQIPTKLNVTIIIICTVLYFFLLQVGSNTPEIGMKLLLGLAFGILMIPVYSLMHEAAHKTLHPNQNLNLFLGQFLSTLFGVSYHFFRHCHLKHHKKNRTDEEMWDLYYEHQNRWVRYGNLYLMMVGFGYFSLWLSIVIFAISPNMIRSKIFKHHKEMRGFVEGLDNSFKMKFFQIESIIIIVFQVFSLWLIGWDFMTWIIFYIIHGFIWSSQNYVNHAFSPRDIINGAHNLTIPKWLNIIYLNFNIHLAHHQNPQIPWIHLPKYIKSNKGRFSFFKNYVRLWHGPLLTKEPSPKPSTNKD
ncbi:fatty acid desaturase family protein [Eudoraea sp.]|uniref:fatty acid desaturase family protein n=1 Tax=Eudoraea sp. TaxID=1979955 RepID=UPI003C72A1C4